MVERRGWTHKEDQAVISLIHQYGLKKWTLISYKMQELFGEVIRSGKQCRERWHNHLNPKINKKPWSEEEDRIIFEAHRIYGNKWAEISKFLSNRQTKRQQIYLRTDNSIKNHFYSTLRRSLRRINKLLGDKNSNLQLLINFSKAQNKSKKSNPEFYQKSLKSLKRMISLLFLILPNQGDRYENVPNQKNT